MPKFDEFMESFSFDPENFDIDKFKAEAAEAYNDDKGVWDAKIADLMGQTEQTQTELQAQKLRNYDLLNKIPVKTVEDQPDPNEKRKSIEDFFTTVPRKG